MVIFHCWFFWPCRIKKGVKEEGRIESQLGEVGGGKVQGTNLLPDVESGGLDTASFDDLSGESASLKKREEEDQLRRESSSGRAQLTGMSIRWSVGMM